MKFRIIGLSYNAGLVVLDHCEDLYWLHTMGQRLLSEDKLIETLEEFSVGQLCRPLKMNAIKPDRADN